MSAVLSVRQPVAEISSLYLTGLIVGGGHGGRSAAAADLVHDHLVLLTVSLADAKY